MTPSADWPASLRALRVLAFVAIGGATVALALSFVPAYQERGNPSADGLQWVVAVIVVPIYGALVVPAFVLALFRNKITVLIAIVLLVIAYAATLVIFSN